MWLIADLRTRLIRRSALEQSLRCGPLEARRTAFSVALAIFWRMRGEVQRAGTIAPGHERHGSGLRDRPPLAWGNCELGVGGARLAVGALAVQPMTAPLLSTPAGP